MERRRTGEKGRVEALEAIAGVNGNFRTTTSRSLALQPPDGGHAAMREWRGETAMSVHTVIIAVVVLAASVVYPDPRDVRVIMRQGAAAGCRE